MPTWTTANGHEVSRLGQGTWKFGESSDAKRREIEALRTGIEHGLVLIDTAEGYAQGESERVVGEAVAGRRDDVFITTKVSPRNGTRDGVPHSLKNSLRRLGTDYVDLYLLHWPSKDHPLAETMEALVGCLERGEARHIGVSNFPTSLWDEAMQLTGGRLLANQVEYGLAQRNPELTLVPYAQAHDVALMSYSPIRHLLGESAPAESRAVLHRIAVRHDATPAAIALAWVLRPEVAPMVTIPKAADKQHVLENLRALDCRLDANDLAELDAAFPPARTDLELETL